MERYPTSIKDDVRLLHSGACSSRKRLAAQVSVGALYGGRVGMPSVV